MTCLVAAAVTEVLMRPMRMGTIEVRSYHLSHEIINHCRGVHVVLL